MALDKSPFDKHPPISHLDEEGIHSLRKKTKQLRAQLQLLRELEGKQQDTEHLRQSVKELARALAQQRDADVLFALLQELLDNSDDTEVNALLRDAQVSLGRPKLPHTDLEKIASLVNEIDKQGVNLNRLKYPDTDINRVLENRLKILCSAGHVLLDSRDWEALHDWRKQVKKLMYQYALKPALSPRDFFVHEHLDGLGSILGKINDFTVLEQFLRELEKSYTRVHTMLVFERLYALITRLRDQKIELAKQLFGAIRHLQ